MAKINPLTAGNGLWHIAQMTQKAISALVAHMKRAELSDTAIAGILDVDRTLVWRWRNGQRMPTLDSIRKIAKVTGKSINTLI